VRQGLGAGAEAAARRRGMGTTLPQSWRVESARALQIQRRALSVQQEGKPLRPHLPYIAMYSLSLSICICALFEVSQVCARCGRGSMEHFFFIRSFLPLHLKTCCRLRARESLLHVLCPAQRMPKHCFFSKDCLSKCSRAACGNMRWKSGSQLE